MSRFIDEADRYQCALLPGTIDEYVSEENPVRAVDAFVGALKMTTLGFQGAAPLARAAVTTECGSDNRRDRS